MMLGPWPKGRTRCVDCLGTRLDHHRRSTPRGPIYRCALPHRPSAFERAVDDHVRAVRETALRAAFAATIYGERFAVMHGLEPTKERTR